MSMEKRRFERYKTMVRSGIYDGLGLNMLAKGYITEISQGGALIETAVDIDLGDEVYVPLRRPDGRSVWIKGQIKRKKKRPAITFYVVEFERTGFFQNMQLKSAVNQMRSKN